MTLEEFRALKPGDTVGVREFGRPMRAATVERVNRSWVRVAGGSRGYQRSEVFTPAELEEELARQRERAAKRAAREAVLVEARAVAARLRAHGLDLYVGADDRLYLRSMDATQARALADALDAAVAK